MDKIGKLIPWALALFVSAVFLDSLRFKFSGHPTTEHIFTTLKEWSGIGLFHPAGPWVIGSAELLAASLLIILPAILALIGLSKTARGLQWLGALVGLGVMSGAILFHLFTPLGIEVPEPSSWVDGVATEFTPNLFITACATWVACALIVVLRWSDIPNWVPILGGRKGGAAL